MTKPKFQMGDRIENIKNRRTGFVRKQRGEDIVPDMNFIVVENVSTPAF